MQGYRKNGRDLKTEIPEKQLLTNGKSMVTYIYYYPVSAVLTECLILSVVEQQDSYGYEISQTVKLVAAIKESTLYPILRKLETGGYLTTYSEEFQGRKRKYYSITEEGRRQLAYLRKEWREYRNIVDDIVEGRVKK